MLPHTTRFSISRGAASPTTLARCPTARHLEGHLRFLMRVFGADLLQGRRLSFSEIRAAMPFATQGQVLAAIDSSCLLRWVDKFESRAKWLGEDDDDHGDGSSGDHHHHDATSATTSNSSDSNNNHIARLHGDVSRQPVPVVIAQTQVFRRYLPRMSFLAMPLSHPNALRSSVPVIIRRRRPLLARFAATHDVALLGTPSQVYLRLAGGRGHDRYAVTVPMLVSRAFVSEGLARSLGWAALGTAAAAATDPDQAYLALPHAQDAGSVAATTAPVKAAFGGNADGMQQQLLQQQSPASVLPSTAAKASATGRESRSTLDTRFDGVVIPGFVSFLNGLQSNMRNTIPLCGLLATCAKAPMIRTRLDNYLWWSDRRVEKRSEFFTRLVCGAMSSVAVPFPVSVLAAQHNYVLPFEIADLTADVIGELGQLVAERGRWQRYHARRQQQGGRGGRVRSGGRDDDDDAECPRINGVVPYPTTDLSLAHMTGQVLRDEIIPLLSRRQRQPHPQDKQRQEGDDAQELHAIIEGGAALLRHRWHGGHVAVIVLALNSRLGFTDFRTFSAAPRDDTAKGLASLLERTREPHRPPAAASRQKSMAATATMEMQPLKLVRRSNDLLVPASADAAQQAQQQQQPPSSECVASAAPLCAFVSDCRITINLLDAVWQACDVMSKQRAGAAGADASWWLCRPRTAADTTTVSSPRPFRLDSHHQPGRSSDDGSAGFDESLAVRLPSTAVTLVTDLNKACDVAGWTLEFGKTCAPELLRRFLVGIARDAAAIRVETQVMLAEDVFSQELGPGALFAFPITASTTSTSAGGGHYRGGTDDVTDWVVLAPKSIRAIASLRRTLEHIAKGTRARHVEAINAEARDDGGGDDCASAKLARAAARKPVVFGVGNGLYVIVVQSSLT